MSNTFVDLPAPAANGSGAAVDVSAFGADKTIVVNGLVSAFVLIEYSNDAAHLVWAPAAPQFNRSGFQNVQIACRYMRATVLNYDGSGAPTVAVGAIESDASFATLVPPNTNGNGVAVDVSALPPYKTVQISGEFRGAMNIEASTNGGATYATVATFSPGSQQTWSGFVTADHMRIMRSGVTGPGVPVPVCYIGSSSAVNGSSGGGGGGTSASDVLTWRPGSGLSGPAVFDSWASLYTQLDTLRTANDDSGLYTIVFDDSAGALEVPVGAWDMTDTRWISVNPSIVYADRKAVVLDDGCAITNLLQIDQGLNIGIPFASATTPITLAAGQSLKVYGSTIGVRHVPIIQVTGDAILVLDDEATVLGDGEIGASIGVSAGVTLTVRMVGAFGNLTQTGLGTYAISGDVGSQVVVYIETPSAYVNGGAVVGPPPVATYILTSSIGRWEGSPNGVVTGTLGFKLIDTLSGTLYTNTDGGTTWT